jgi:hypothetical protein
LTGAAPLARGRTANRWGRRGRRPGGVVPVFCLSLACLAFGCQRRGSSPPPAAAESGLSHAPNGPRGAGFKLADAPPLPENPAQGQRAQAEWRQHLAREEEERQAAFDRRRLTEHRGIVAGLRATASSCRAVSNRRELEKRTQILARAVTALDKQIAALDPWGNSSRLLPSYATLRDQLARRCPEAMEAALNGAPNDLAETKRALAAGFSEIAKWLEEIAEDEKEPAEPDEERAQATARD